MKKHLPIFRLHLNSVMDRVLRRGAHVCWYGVAVLGALVAIVVVGARLLLPLAEQKKPEIEALLSRASGYTVRIEHLTGFWEGLHPGLRMQGIGVFAADSTRPAVHLAELRISLQWLPLLIGRAEIHSLVLTRPKLALERLSDGRYRVSGFDPIEVAAPAKNEMFVTWLFRQDRIDIEDGELQWLDRRDPGRGLPLRHVNLRLRNSGERHQLGMAAEFPEAMCDTCSLIADIKGNPFLAQSFKGQLYLRGRDVNVERLPRIVREQLPEALRGMFSVELWSQWDESRPTSVEGDVAVANLRLPVTGLRAPLSVKQASSHLRWQGTPDDFRFALDHLMLALHGAPWSAGDFEFLRRGSETGLRVARIELADISAFVAELHSDSNGDGLPYQELAKLWTALKPEGAVKELRAKLSGALDAPQDFALSADVEALALAPFRDWPGVSGLIGHLSVDRDAGEFELDMRQGALAMPGIFRAPLPVERASARVRWRRQTDQWLVTAEDIAFANDDGRANGQLALRLPHDNQRSPHLALNANIRDGSGLHAARYYPVRQLPPATLVWMERAFGGGTVTDASVVFDGQIRDFPFPSNEGKFEIRAKVRDGVYTYLSGWQPLTGATANVFVTGTGFLITGSGRVGALAANDIVVGSGDAGSVRVKLNITGPMAESLRILREAQIAEGDARWQRWLSPALEAAGPGALSLDLNVPPDGKPTVFHGEYRFLNAMLRFAGSPGEASGITGSVQFTEAGVNQGQVRAMFFGGETSLSIATPRTDETVATLRGQVTTAGLTSILGARLASRVSGAAPWEAQLRLSNGRREVSADVDLSGLRATLPAPLNRPLGFGPDKLMVRTETMTRDSQVLRISAGGTLQGRIRYTHDRGWRFHSGRLLFYESPVRQPLEPILSAEPGWQLVARLNDFNLDDWLSLIGDDPSAGSLKRLTRVTADIRDLTFLDRGFGQVGLRLGHEKNGWSGTITGPLVDGRLQLDTAAATAIDLDLERLQLAPAKHADRAAPDPRRLPRVVIKAKAFQFRDKELGQLEFSAFPIEHGWRIERSVLVRPETRVETDGFWRVEFGRPTTQFNLRLTSQNFDATLTALGMPDQVAGAEVDLKARLSWPGSPMEIKYANLSGNLELEAKNGRFLKVKQGAGRLFGLLDLSAVGRYLTLDFTPIFGQGFAFDYVRGQVSIAQGDVALHGLSIKGPSAKIDVNGRVGLAREDFDLTMDVYPSLIDSLTIAGWAVGGPPALLWSLVVQKIFKKQIDEGTRITYVVKGPWDKPDIARKLIEGEKSTNTSP